MSELSPREYEAILRSDLGYFAERCFYELNPQAAFLTNWHIDVIAAKLTAVREGKIRRLIINLPTRHLKSLMASIAFPAWCLGHDPRRRSCASAMPRISPTSSPASTSGALTLRGSSPGNQLAYQAAGKSPRSLQNRWWGAAAARRGLSVDTPSIRLCGEGGNSLSLLIRSG
jgi:hypothetical protein